MRQIAGAARILCLLAAALLTACQSFAPLPPPHSELPVREAGKAPSASATRPGSPSTDSAPLAGEIPADLANTPDAVPVPVVPTRRGNPDRYEARGETYSVQKQPAKKGYYETGRASWYGKQFHGRKTANGEIYDMFAMTAAHKTLRLPSFVKVTNIDNGLSCVVKVNDRGPFVKGRIIDLSYAAATKIDLIHHGHANVVIEVVQPDGGTEAAEDRPRYLEVETENDPIAAIAQRESLRRLDYAADEILQRLGSDGGPGVQVLRIGPFEDLVALEKARLRLEKEGFQATVGSD